MPDTAAAHAVRELARLAPASREEAHEIIAAGALDAAAGLEWIERRFGSLRPSPEQIESAVGDIIEELVDGDSDQAAEIARDLASWLRVAAPADTGITAGPCTAADALAVLTWIATETAPSEARDVAAGFLAGSLAGTRAEHIAAWPASQPLLEEIGRLIDRLNRGDPDEALRYARGLLARLRA